MCYFKNIINIIILFLYYYYIIIVLYYYYFILLLFYIIILYKYYIDCNIFTHVIITIIYIRIEVIVDLKKIDFI